MATIPPEAKTASMMITAFFHRARKSFKWAAIRLEAPGKCAFAACKTEPPMQGMATHARVRPSSLTPSKPSASPLEVVKPVFRAIRLTRQP